MSKKSKVFSFQGRIVRIVDDKSKGIIKYDSDNAFPQNIVKQTMESGTATSCIDKLAQYIYAEGFSDESFGTSKANPFQTFNDLASELKYCVANFQATSWYIMRASDGSIAQVKTIPFETIRKRLDGDFVVNDTFGCYKYDPLKDCIYPEFRGPKISTQELQEHILKYGIDKGEILYFFDKKPLRNHYPIPSYFAAISDIDTDAENSKIELESANNSFVTSGILNVVGKIDDKNPDEKGMTEWDYLDEDLKSFTGNVKNEKGETNRQKMMVIHSTTKEELAVFTPITNEGTFNAIDRSTDRVANKVARAFGVPPFLIGLGGNVGFSTNIIADNITLFNNSIGSLQDLISVPLKKMFPDKDSTLTKLQPIKYILPEVMAQLTPDELRALEGYAPKQITQPL